MIQVSDSLRMFYVLNTPMALFGEPSRSGLGGKTKHVQNVVRLGMQLEIPDEVNKDLLEICLALHDIGRSV